MKNDHHDAEKRRQKMQDADDLLCAVLITFVIAGTVGLFILQVLR